MKRLPIIPCIAVAIVALAACAGRSDPDGGSGKAAPETTAPVERPVPAASGGAQLEDAAPTASSLPASVGSISAESVAGTEAVDTSSATASGTIAGVSGTVSVDTSNNPAAPKVVMNGNTSRTKSRSVTLSLEMTGKTESAYYLASESSTPPALTAAGWQPFAASTPYELAGGDDGARTVYVWVKSGPIISPVGSDVIILDTSAPQISATSPADQASGVSAGSAITVTFSEAVDPATVTTRTLSIVPQGGGDPIVGELTVEGINVTFRPSAVLRPGLAYAIRVAGGAEGISDLAGNPLAGNKSYAFTTATRSVVVKNGDAGTAVRDVTLSLIATDSLGTTGYIASESGTAPAASAVWLPFANQVPFRLSAADGEKSVYVWFKNSAEMVSAPASDTIILDTTGPDVSRRNPEPGSYAVRVGAAILITMNEELDPESVGPRTITLIQPPAAEGGVPVAVAGETTLSGDTVRFDPDRNLPNGVNLTVTLKGGVGGVKDLVGNAMAADATFSFNTEVAVPSNVRAVGSLTASGQVDLAWDAVTGAAGYKIYRSQDPDFLISEEITSAERPWANPFADPGRMVRATYYYRVTAVDAGRNESPPSESPSVTVPDILKPDSPSIVINGRAVRTGTRSVSLRLGASDAEGVTGFFVSENPVLPETGPTWSPLPAAGGVDFEIQSEGFDGATKTVYAWFKDEAGNVSDAAEDSIILDMMAPGVNDETTPLRDQYVVSTGTSVRVTFNEEIDASTCSDLTVFLIDELTRASVGAVVGCPRKPLTGTATEAILRPFDLLAAGTPYTATIKGGAGGVKDLVGNPLPADVSFTFTTALAVPSGVTVEASPTPQGVDLAWSAMGGLVASYRVYRSTTSGFAPSPETLITGSGFLALGLADTGLAETTRYYYRVSAVDPGGNETAASEEAGITVPDYREPTDPRLTLKNGDVYTNQRTIGVTVSAVDAAGVATYFISESAATPEATAGGWILYTSVEPFRIDSAGDGTKRVYAWFKDNTGNISAPAMDDIILDETPPTVTVTPSDGAFGVDQGANVTMLFSERIDASTFTPAVVGLIELQPSDDSPAGSVSYDSGSRTGTFDPSASLVDGGKYLLLIRGGAGGVKDLAGNSLVTNVVVAGMSEYRTGFTANTTLRMSASTTASRALNLSWLPIVDATSYSVYCDRTSGFTPSMANQVFTAGYADEFVYNNRTPTRRDYCKLIVANDQAIEAISNQVDALPDYFFQTVGIAAYATSPSVKVDASGRVHIAYYNTAAQDLMYVTNVLGSADPWTPVTVDSANSVDKTPSLALDANGKVHIGYYGATTGAVATVEGVKYATNVTAGGNFASLLPFEASQKPVDFAINQDQTRKFFAFISGSSLGYAESAVPTGPWSQSTTSGGGTPFVSVTMDSNNKPYVAFVKTGFDVVALDRGFLPPKWALVQTVESTGSDVKDAVMVNETTGTSNRQHIAYEYYNSGTAARTLKYALLSGGNVTKAEITGSNIIGASSLSIAVDANSKVFISYFGDTPEATSPTTSDLKLATNMNGTWSVLRLDQNSIAGRESSMALDPATGKVRIVHNWAITPTGVASIRLTYEP